MWEFDHKEGWVPKNPYFWMVVLENSLENHLDSREIIPVNPKGNQSWTFVGRTDAEAEATILWPPDAKSWLTRKDPDTVERLRERGKGRAGQKIRWLDGINDSMDMSLRIGTKDSVSDKKKGKTGLHGFVSSSILTQNRIHSTSS